MTDERDGGAGPKGDVRISQGRSPAYPYIDLEKAVERAHQVRAAGAARQAMAPETFYQIWKLGASSSGARQTMAALNHFGLANYQARGDSRKVKLSDLALKIVLDTQPVSAERDAALKDAALSPAIHGDLFEKYGPLLPADFVIQTYLVRDRGYNEQAAKSLISEYKDTLSFAGLDKPANMPADDGKPPRDDLAPETVEVGDLVNVERDGALVFPKAVKVLAVDERDGQVWVWTDGSEAWTEMESVILEAKASSDSGKGVTPPPPPAVVAAALAAAAAQAEGKLGPGIQEDKFSTDEGVVTVRFPDSLTVASVNELEEFFSLFIKKAKRRAASQ
jgi:hypothetical protein